MGKSIKTVFFLAIFSIVFLNDAFATEKGDITVCAAVMPCDKEGNVLDEYAIGDCLDIYQERCLAERIYQLSENATECQCKVEKKNKKIRRLKKRIKYLESK